MGYQRKVLLYKTLSIQKGVARNRFLYKFFLIHVLQYRHKKQNYLDIEVDLVTFVWYLSELINVDVCVAMYCWTFKMNSHVLYAFRNYISKQPCCYEYLLLLQYKLATCIL